MILWRELRFPDKGSPTLALRFWKDYTGTIIYAGRPTCQRYRIVRDGRHWVAQRDLSEL